MQQLLIVLPSWVGDVVMATPLLRALRNRFSTDRIALLLKPSLIELLSGGDWADELLAWQMRVRGGQCRPSVWKTAGMLRKQGFDTAILLPNAFRAALLARLAGIPRRIGYDRDGRGLLLTDKLIPLRAGGRFVVVPMVRYFGAIAEFLGCASPGDVLELFTEERCERAVEQRLCLSGIGAKRPLVLVCPGASFGSSKLWLPERFAALADQLVREFDAAIVISCAPGEEVLARRVHAAMKTKGIIFDEPPGTLGEFKALVRLSDLVINNDTGPRHVAKAFGISVVTIFGSTDPRWTDTEYGLERKVRIDLDCSPCQKPICPLGHHNCMTGVSVEMVADACRELLRQRLRPSPNQLPAVTALAQAPGFAS